MNIRKNYLIIPIENDSRDFKKIWNKIENLKNRDRESLSREEYSNFYYYDVPQEIGGYRELIIDINEKFSFLPTVDLETLPSDYGICLWIKDCEENDTIEYQYLALMLQNFDNIIGYIYPDQEQRSYVVYQKVSWFFSFFIHKNNRKECIWVRWTIQGNHRLTMLGTELENNSYRINPVIELEQDGKGDSDLKAWTRTVEEFLQQCPDYGEIRNMESYQEILIQLTRAKQNETEPGLDIQQKWEKKRQRQEELSRKNRDNRLLCQCVNYFVASAESKSIAQIERYRNLLWSSEIQELLKEVSLLTFYVLCMQLYFMKGRATIEAEEIKLHLVNAGEIAEGIIQLLENLHHSSEKRGLLSIRVHEWKEGENYLSRNYPDLYSEKSAQFYYEFRILDYSAQGIVENFRNKRNIDEESEVKITEDFCIKDFFEYTDESGFWKEYNKTADNMVHHYGLQIFATIVSNNNGYFSVESTSGRQISEKERYSNRRSSISDVKEHIPGTEYRVLLPMLREGPLINPSVDADIQYQFDLKKEYRMVPFDMNVAYADTEYLNNGDLEAQALKEQRVNKIKDAIIMEFNPEKEQNEMVLLLSAMEWGGRKTEIYCKALMLCLIEWEPANEQGFYTIIQDCTSNDFIEITRMFAIFYGKQELNKYMKRMQIYLSGVNQSEEFLIAGSDISGLMAMAGKLTLVRGIQPQCMRSIEYIFNKFNIKNEQKYSQNQELQLVPFDILEIPGNSPKTLFEKAVKKVLESDLQKYSFGCKLKHTHMRLGSKIHIGEFYEAELLFHNNYYVARFALLIIRRLKHILKKDVPVMFVGYETYSELLLYEIVTNLNEDGYESSYMLYEQRKEGKFRYYNSVQYIENKKNIEFILIVPINSSLTTHSKLRASLISEIDRLNLDFNVKALAQYALILIRSRPEDSECDEMESRYCESMKYGKIMANYLPEGEREIDYFVCVNTEWFHPLRCRLCFPKQSMLEEQPLTETNRASIIPIQMVGIREKDIFEYTKQKEIGQNGVIESVKKENMERVKKLGEMLIYRHIVRRGNHFMFYFELEKYFMHNRDDIIEWLKGIRTQQKKGEGIVYDVIVAPLHFSNAGFVAEVNHYLYGNAALVLNLEVDKEFRENVRTKYSNIIGLYKKLLDMETEAELRFHFVDDNIITGNTFSRAKSLFTSLLPTKRSEKVKVNVFEDVIVILNRMSEASIMNCVSDRKEYHAYVSLNISAMRNHEDACVLCKAVENAQTLRNRSSTNIMYEFWDKKMVHHRIIEEEYQDEYVDRENEEQRERACRRMLCTHIVNERLAQLGYLQNDTAQVKEVMLSLLKEKKDAPDALEWIISYVKIFSRPFVSFRKSNREAAFRIMLELLEFIVNELVKSEAKIRNQKFTNYKELKEVCCVIRDAGIKHGQDEKIYSLILTLMQRLSALGSNYVIRKENLNKLFAIVKHLNITDKKREEFQQRYLNIVKRVTCLSSDESKCIYLEYLLMYGEEFENEEMEKEKRAAELSDKFELRGEGNFLEILFLENSRVLYDGVRELAEEFGENADEKSLLQQIQSKYYYDNFRRLLYYYQFLVDDGDSVEFQPGKNKVVLTLVKLYCMLSKETELNQERDVELFYNNLLEYIEVITDAKIARFLFLYDVIQTEGNAKKRAYTKQRGTEIGLEEMEYMVDEFLYDTYKVVRGVEDTKVLIKYRNYVGEEYSAKEKSQMNDVYLELTFSPDITQLKMLIALKCIMVFRNLVIQNLEKDFSNNLMQKWSAEQTLKKNMKLERAADHTDKDELAEYLKMISQDISSWDIKYQKALFELVINSYIARINVQLLTDTLPEGENVEYPFAFVYKQQLKALIDCLHQFQKFQIIDENGDEKFSEKVLQARLRMYRDEHRNDRMAERLPVKRLSIIIIELIRSAVKYSDDKKVYIYREGNCLVVKNSFKSKKKITVIQQEARDAYSRKKEGISLAVIKELVDKFYSLNDGNDVIIDAEMIGRRKFYYVKLPILEDRKGR